jgi:hypothetical protein
MNKVKKSGPVEQQPAKKSTHHHNRSVSLDVDENRDFLPSEIFWRRRQEETKRVQQVYEGGDVEIEGIAPADNPPGKVCVMVSIGDMCTTSHAILDSF